ncbi:MAG: helix-turn-helix domain-containing protein [Pseudobdellovibrionaceae bacterium]
MTQRALKSAHNQASANRIQQMSFIIDHLVDALAGDPSSPLRRAQILVDIDEHPNTTQSEVAERLDIGKSALNREIDWLYDHGCLLRQAGQQDGRVIHMLTCGYSKKNLDLALDYFNLSHKNLQKFLESLINIFTEGRPTFRDAKLLTASADVGPTGRQELFSRAYGGAQTTNVRSLDSLIEQGLMSEVDE